MDQACPGNQVSWAQRGMRQYGLRFHFLHSVSARKAEEGAVLAHPEKRAAEGAMEAMAAPVEYCPYSMLVLRRFLLRPTRSSLILAGLATVVRVVRVEQGVRGAWEAMVADAAAVDREVLRDHLDRLGLQAPSAACPMLARRS